MPTLDVAFAGPVLRGAFGGMTTHYVPLPDDIADAYAAEGVRRVVVAFNGFAARRAILRTKDGLRYLAMGRPILDGAGVATGEPVVVEMAPDPEPDRVDLGPLADVLAGDAVARERFERFTPGRQRSLAYHVTSAKRPETQRARAEEIAHKLATHTLHGDRPRGDAPA